MPVVDNPTIDYDKQAPEGKYVLLKDRFDQLVGQSPKGSLLYKSWKRGDVIWLDTDDATRLLALGAVEEVGSSQKRRLAELKAQQDNILRQLEELEEHDAPKAEELPDRSVRKPSPGRPRRELPVGANVLEATREQLSSGDDLPGPHSELAPPR